MIGLPLAVRDLVGDKSKYFDFDRKNMFLGKLQFEYSCG
jgi:hypothetical protein